MDITDWTLLPLTDPLDQPVDHPLIGQRVTVTLARAGEYKTHAFPGEPEPERHEADQTITGILLGLKAGGDACVRQDDGQQMWGWPALEIHAAPLA